MNLPANVREIVPSLIGDNSTSLWATKASVSQLLSLWFWAHEAQLLSWHAIATEAYAPTACSQQQEKLPNEKHMHHKEE